MSRSGSQARLAEGMPRSGSRAQLGQGASSSDRAPVFPVWQPSERVQNLTDEQVADIRQRLNVTVDAGENPKSPPPIESFMDMVSQQGREGAIWQSPTGV